MKIDLAVYTAQEGYSWQPGTAISADVLKAFKARIGKFPSPDAVEFPFGGVFLEGDRVVFYRYHVAKKIDFRGRDALYCVLGVLPVLDASKVNIKSLFAKPQFAGPMQPFPTAVEIAEVAESDVPEWLRNLDIMSLDVRITGTIDDMKCEVKQKQVEFPPPEQKEEAKPETSFQSNQMLSQSAFDFDKSPVLENNLDAQGQTSIPSRMSGSSSATCADVLVSDSHKNPLRKARPCCKSPFVIFVGIVAVLIIAGLFVILSLILSCINSFRNENPVPVSVDRKSQFVSKHDQDQKVITNDAKSACNKETENNVSRRGQRMDRDDSRRNVVK